MSYTLTVFDCKTITTPLDRRGIKAAFIAFVFAKQVIVFIAFVFAKVNNVFAAVVFAHTSTTDSWVVKLFRWVVIVALLFTTQ